MTLNELLAAQPGLMAEHEKMVLDKAARANAPVPATVAQLKEHFPGAENSLFREECLEKSLTVDGARAAYAGVIGTQLEAAKAENARLAEENSNLKKLGTQGTGTDPVAAGPGRDAGGKPGTAEGYDSAVAALTSAKLKQGKPLVDARAEAYTEAARNDPDGHDAWKIREAEAMAERSAQREKQRR